MNPFAVVFAFCCLASAQARPGYSHGGGSIQLQGVPDASHYGKLTYPKYDILDLGSSSKDSVPPTVIQISTHHTVKEPQPYPVKVPYPVPHPVPVAKPYPVVETKLIKVPHPVPYEVVKKIPVPFEVPKPYPVPAEEFKAPNQHAPVASYGGSFEGHDQGGYQQLSGGYEGGDQGGEQHSFGGGYDGGFGGEHARADQSGDYEAAGQAQEGGWNPSQGGGYDNGAAEVEQQEEQH